MHIAYKYNNITYIIRSDGMTILQALIKIRENMPAAILITSIARNYFTFDEIEQSKNKDRVNLIGSISYYNVPKNEIVIISREKKNSLYECKCYCFKE